MSSIDATSQIVAGGGGENASMAPIPTTGRRRTRRTTGASGGMSDRSGMQTGPMGLDEPIAAQTADPIRSPMLETLESLAEDIADVPPGSNLPPVRTPAKPTRMVAPLPIASSAGEKKAAGAAEPPIFYLQKASGFRKTKGWPAMFYHSRRSAADAEAAGRDEQKEFEERRQAEKNELLSVGVVVQRVQQTTGKFICGVLAGFTLWYAIVAQLLFVHLVPGANDSGEYLKSEMFATFILFYEKMSMPVGCLIYALLAFCLLTIVDRYDISVVSRPDFIQALRLQNTAIPLLLLYTGALVLTLVCTQYDARIYGVSVENLNQHRRDQVGTTQLQLRDALSTPGASATQTTTAKTLPLFLTTPKTTSPAIDVDSTFSLTELGDAVTYWLRLGFARAACCCIAWLVLVISSDEDRLIKYLQSLMDQMTLKKQSQAVIDAGPQSAVAAVSAAPLSLEPTGTPQATTDMAVGEANLKMALGSAKNN